MSEAETQAVSVSELTVTRHLKARFLRYGWRAKSRMWSVPEVVMSTSLSKILNHKFEA